MRAPFRVKPLALLLLLLGLALTAFLALEAARHLPAFARFWHASVHTLERSGWAAHYGHPSEPFLLGRCLADTGVGGCNANRWLEAESPLPWTWMTAALALSALGSLALGWTLLWRKTPPPPPHSGHLAQGRDTRPLLVRQTRRPARGASPLGRPPHLTHSLLLAAPLRGKGRYLANFPTPARREHRHVLLLGESGSGKGDTLLANLLNWAYSSVVLDLGGEAWAKTAGYRATLGPVYRLDFAGRGHAYNPFAVRTDDAGLAELADLLADTHAGDSERGAEFRRKAASGFQAALHLALERGVPDTLGFLLGLFSSPRAYRAALEGASPSVQQRAGLFLGEDAFALNSFSLAQNGVATLDVSGIHRLFSRVDVSVSELRERPTTVYLSVDAHASAEEKAYRILMRTLFSELRRHPPGLPVLVIADELDAHPIPEYPSLVSTLRKYGVTLLTSIQDLAQLEAHYGKTGREAILSSSAFTIFLRQNSPQNLEHLAGLSGMASVETLATSEQPRDPRRRSLNYAHTSRRVLEPMEVFQRGEDRALLLAPGLPLIDCRRLTWRGDPVLRARAALPPPEPGGRRADGHEVLAVPAGAGTLEALEAHGKPPKEARPPLEGAAEPHVQPSPQGDLPQVSPSPPPDTGVVPPTPGAPSPRPRVFDDLE